MFWPCCKACGAIIAIGMFLQGFLPIKTPLQGYASPRHCNSSTCRPIFDKMVLVIIDALRSDFVFNSTCERWPYLCQLISQQQVLQYRAQVHPPTVTLPRIKALTSGDIPGFVDIILNFDSKQFVYDNLVHQIRAKNMSLVFYGDDTWLRMFPGYFLRSEGTTSFFVNDYTEVDDNVTRQMSKELGRFDWDVMILHYLGLDHIGHLVGPNSELVKPKLQEMDSVIQKIHYALKKMDKEEKTSSLLVLCGDHGMAEQGGHGGVSPGEISTPLILISDGLATTNTIEDVYQNDLVPTLASLLALPIPQNSLGVAITSALKANTNTETLIDALGLNAAQLSKLAMSSRPDLREGELALRYESLKRVHHIWKTTQQDPSRADYLVNEYVDLMMRLRDTIAATLTKYDEDAMFVGLSLIALVFLNVVIDIIMSHNAAQLKIMPSISAAFAILTLFWVYCTRLDSSTCLCESYTGCAAAIISVPLLAKVLSFLCNLQQLIWIESLTVTSISADTALLVAMNLLHSVSLLSTSFIEEEHQLAYFYSSSALLLILLQRGIRSRDLTVSSFSIFATLLLAAFLRKWNQTGDKWAHLPDIADILSRPENELARVVTVLLSYTICCYLTVRGQGRTLLLVQVVGFTGGLLFIIQELGYASYTNRGCTEAAVVYSCVLATALLAMYQMRLGDVSTGIGNLRSALVLLSLLLHRPINVPVMAFLVVQQQLLAISMPHVLNPHTQLFVYFWFGQSSFFYQGNSNALNTIDVSAGYKGLSNYHPATAAVLILINTYSGPIFWTLSYAQLLCINITTHRNRSGWKKAFDILLGIKVADVLFFLFLIIIERYHLFVWSVLAPKLMYECVSLVMVVSYNLIAHFVNL